MSQRETWARVEEVRAWAWLRLIGLERNAAGNIYMATHTYITHIYILYTYNIYTYILPFTVTVIVTTTTHLLRSRLQKFS